MMQLTMLRIAADHPKTLGRPHSVLGMGDISIEQVDPSDDEIVEEWVLAIDDEVLGVDCSRSEDDDWPWRVDVCVMEFVRSEPLESELVSAITTALRQVPGVRDAQQEDREAWLVAGDPAGQDLAQAVGEVVDHFAPQARTLLDGLATGAESSSKPRPWWRFW